MLSCSLLLVFLHARGNCVRFRSISRQFSLFSFRSYTRVVCVRRFSYFAAQEKHELAKGKQEASQPASPPASKQTCACVQLVTCRASRNKTSFEQEIPSRRTRLFKSRKEAKSHGTLRHITRRRSLRRGSMRLYQSNAAISFALRRSGCVGH